MGESAFATPDTKNAKANVSLRSCELASFKENKLLKKLNSPKTPKIKLDFDDLVAKSGIQMYCVCGRTDVHTHLKDENDPFLLADTFINTDPPNGTLSLNESNLFSETIQSSTNGDTIIDALIVTVKQEKD